NRYLHGPQIDQVFADQSTADGLLWSLADHQGTVRDWADYDSGTNATAVVDHVKYDSFGTITSQSGTTHKPLFAYTGREWDADAGMYYYRMRWYDPSTGRFIAEDPMGFAAGDPNLSRYVRNRPATSTDPSGLEERDYVFEEEAYGMVYNPNIAAEQEQGERNLRFLREESDSGGDDDIVRRIRESITPKTSGGGDKGPLTNLDEAADYLQDLLRSEDPSDYLYPEMLGPLLYRDPRTTAPAGDQAFGTATLNRNREEIERRHREDAERRAEAYHEYYKDYLKNLANSQGVDGLDQLFQALEDARRQKNANDREMYEDLLKGLSP
nr:RHS repeat-associated core domain-containing protein [Planctomycetota bacterium]